MSWLFGGKAANKEPNTVDVSTGSGTAAEQDRLGQYFGVSDKKIDWAKQAASDLTTSNPEPVAPWNKAPNTVDVSSRNGSGAEQDRYGKHFEGIGDKAADEAKQAASYLRGSGQQAAEEAKQAGSQASSWFGSKKNQAAEGAKQAADEAKQAGSQTSSWFGSKKDQAASEAKQTASYIRGTGQQAAEEAKQAGSQASSWFGSKKDQAAEGSKQAADEAKRAGSQASSWFGSKKDQAADEAKQAASYARSTGQQAADRAKSAAATKGPGAEQDRYQLHFGLDAQQIKSAVDGLIQAAEKGPGQQRYTSRFGLGYDGWQRAQLLAQRGAGAEQDRFGSRFGLDKRTVQAAADKVQSAAESVKQGAEHNLGTK